MDDNQSTNTEATVATESPDVDPILATLSDTEVTSTDESSDDDAETQEVEESTEETTPEVEPTKEETEEVEPTVDPKEEAQRRYEERQKLRAERDQRIAQQTSEYTRGAEDEYDQRVRAIEVQQYTALIERNESTLVNEFERVKANPDLQIFNPDNKDLFNEKAYTKAIKDYNAGYLQYDQNGNMVGIKGSLFEHLTETAELLQDSIKRGAVQQVKDSQKMRSNADTKPSAPPKEKAPDPILDILSSD